MQIQQGDIYLVDLNPSKGHEQGGFRPVLILQNNKLNKYLNTVVIAPITSNLKAKGHLTTHFLKTTESRLNQDSVILLHHIRAIDKHRLKKHIFNLSPDKLSAIRRQLGLIL